MAIRRIGKHIGLVILGAVFLFAAYLVVPNPLVSSPHLEDYPREAPVVFDSATQCKSETAYVTASQIGYSDFEIVDERCSSLQRDLVDAARDGDTERIRRLIQQGANVNSPGWPTLGGNGLNPPWYSAIWYKRTDVVKLLLDNGVSPNRSFSCCANHSSMLMVAITAQDVETTKLLIKRGADLNFVGDFGWSVIDLAERSKNQQIESLVLAACNSDIQCRAQTRARRIGLAFGMSEEIRKL